jgi:hypothetical protein
MSQFEELLSLSINKNDMEARPLPSTLGIDVEESF